MKKVVQPVRKAYAPHQNVVRRVLNSQAPVQVATQPRILKQKLVAVASRCFVCDETIDGRGFPLLMASTLSSKTTLPNKIGKLMGDGFMVVVSMDDVICKRCAALFNHLDRLEADLERVSSTLAGYLKVKYKLLDDDSDGPPSKIAKITDESVDDPGPSQQEIETQLSHMFGSPVRVAPKEEIKSKPAKMYKCVSCDFKTSDLTLFQPHYEQCQLLPHKCKQCDKAFVDIKYLRQHTIDSHPMQTCSLCNITFVDDAVYKKHLETHFGDKEITEIKKHHICTVCSYKTNDKQIFDEHMKKHIKLRPFKCRVCSQRFESREQATIHAKAHQPDYFKCGLCSATFQRRETLMKHLETHERSKTSVPVSSITVAPTSTTSTQRLLQASIEEALRDTNIEVDAIKTTQQEGKQIEFYTCTTCSLTFLNELIYAQHMKQHNTTSKKSGQSLIRQDVRNANVSILNPAQSNNALTEGDLESMFEKMHSEKVETSQTATLATVTTTESGNITFNINIPEDLNEDEDMSGNLSVKKHENVLIFKCDTCNEAYADNDHLQLHLLTSGHGSSGATHMTIDMPNLDQPDEEGGDAANPEQQNSNSVDGNTQDVSSVDNKVGESENNSQQGPTEVTDHVPESNTEPVPMELEEDMNNCERNEIKLMLDGDNQLITSDGQILQLDNHILTDSDGNQIIASSDGQLLTVQGADNEQIQQLLQSVGVVVQNEDGNEDQLQMLDNSQMVLVQTENGETKLISSDMLDKANIVIQHDGEEGSMQMTFEQAQAAGIDLSSLMAKQDDMEEHEGDKSVEEGTLTFNLDELCQLQNEQIQNDDQIETEEQNDDK